MRATRRGQYAAECAVLLAAMVAAVMLMQSYVNRALRASVKSTEAQLNGAMGENRP